ncbi:MAG: HAMP domain-containing sensor histidine kinase [Balneola sp.]
MDRKLSFYSLISKLKWPKGYTGKIFLIAFIGTHIPLIGLFIYLTIYFPVEERVSILLVVLVATVIGASVTLYFIFRLLAPILMTNKAVIKYNSDKKIPSLPKHFEDEAGVLMANTQKCIEELDDLLKLKNRLIAMVSHDSKTPIGSIKIANELIKDELQGDNPDLKDIFKYIELIEISTDSHARFLDNMLTLARFDDGEIHLNKNEVAPEDIFNKLAKNHKIYFEMKGIEFITNSELPDGFKLNVDVEKMISVLNNLIQNSIKFTKQDGKIELNLKESEGRYLITVKDNGVGIPDAQKKNIFSAFSDSSEGTKNEIGSGLGLWIVKVFTDLHKGVINFESEEGEGTTFTLSLPKS